MNDNLWSPRERAAWCPDLAGRGEITAALCVSWRTVLKLTALEGLPVKGFPDRPTLGHLDLLDWRLGKREGEQP